MAVPFRPYVASRPDNNTLTIHTASGSPFAFTFDSNPTLASLRYERSRESAVAHSGSVCGKRSRSNSSSIGSSGDSSLQSTTSSQQDSIFDISDCLNLSPSTSPSSSYASSQDIVNMSENDSDSCAIERACHSPSAGARKAIRCTRKDTACKVASSPSRAHSIITSPKVAPEIPAVAPASQFSQDSQDSQDENEGVSILQPIAVPSIAGGERSSFVDHLVDAAVCTLESIWPDVNTTACTAATTTPQGLPLRYFVRETLRRSRTSCSTLQTALLYCVRAGPAIRELRTNAHAATGELAQDVSSLSLGSLDISGTGPKRSSSPLLPSVSSAAAAASSSPSAASSPLHCARRTFLSSLILSSKFLQDKTYSLRAWSKISGLGVKELAHIERTLLRAVGYSLKVDEDEWQSWTAGLCTRVQEQGSAAVIQTEQSTASVASETTVVTPIALRKGVAIKKVSTLGLARTQSDNITGAALPYDSDLPAPVVPSIKASVPSVDISSDGINASSTPTLESMIAAVAAAQQVSGLLGTPTPSSVAAGHTQAKTHVSLSSAAAAIGFGLGSPYGSPSPSPSPRRAPRGPSGVALNNREGARRNFSAARR